MPACCLRRRRSESRRQLDAALRGWADWHHAKYPAGYVPPSVFSGTLSYAPGAMEVRAP